MTYEPPEAGHGCFRYGCGIFVVIAAAFFVIAGANEIWTSYSLTRPSTHMARLQKYVPGFQCDNVSVVKIYSAFVDTEVIYPDDGGGAMLSMPKSCRTDLLQRAQRSPKFTDRLGDDRFLYHSRFSMIELSFEANDKVYFGAYRRP